MIPSFLQATADGIIVSVLVQPRASKNEIIGAQGEELKVRLTSPPVEGAANQSCREFFAKRLGIAKGQVELVAGDKSRHKRLLLRDVDLKQVLAALDIPES